MTNLEILIQELCPDGVEFRTMEEVFEIRNGYTPSKNNPDFWEGGTIPWFRMEDIRQNGRILSDAIQHITPAAIKGKGLFPANSIIIATTATIGEHALVIADSLANQQFTNLVVRKSLSACLLPKFVFYYMFVIDEWCKKNVNAGNFASVDMKRFKKLEFPLPPIEVQTEIVRILDKFTSLEAELEAELDCRKRQYEYYRDKLLSFDNVGGQEVTISKIGDIGRICMCKRIMKNQTNSESGIPFYKIGTFGKVADAYISNDVYEEYKKLYSYPKKGDILMSASGTIGRTVVFNGKPSYFQDSNIVWVDNDETKVFNSYLNYYYQIIEWKTQGGTIKRLYNNLLAGATIKYPSLEEQHRIVSILNRFESLTTSLQSGLPAEIVARRQQYEHYRDKLLTFKRKGAA
mgnify:CR=1 FL=1